MQNDRICEIGRFYFSQRPFKGRIATQKIRMSFLSCALIEALTAILT
jgi:hypothetical protein